LTLQVPNRAELLSIKAGAVAYDDLMEQADALVASIEHLHSHCLLPESPDIAKGKAVLVAMRKVLYG
jgi:uncharacterized protein